jgi:hypothetical protein
LWLKNKEKANKSNRSGGIASFVQNLRAQLRLFSYISSKIITDGVLIVPLPSFFLLFKAMKNREVIGCDFNF